MIPNWEYQTDEVALVPYDRAWPLFPDGLLGHLYLRTKQDDLLETAFCGQDPCDFDWFVGYLGKANPTVQVYCYQNGDEPLLPVGYCYTNGVSGPPGNRRATFGFCFFKEYWGDQRVRDLVWLCLRYWMEVGKIDVLHGITLVDNFLARNFSRRFGFTEVAVIPKFLYRQGGLTSARVVVLERATFESLYERWRNARAVQIP